MKVYSWKTLVAALCALGFIIWKISHFDGLTDLVWIGLLSYYFVQGLKVAFNREACEKDRLRGRVGKREKERLFGKYAFWADHGALLMFLLAGLAALLWGSRAVWVILTLVIAAAVYAVWYAWYFRKHADLSDLEE